MINDLINIITWKYADSSFGCGETYSSLVWHEDNNIAKPTLQEIEQADVEYSAYKQATAYREQRAKEYPSIVDQLDLMYHEGYNGWHSAIQAIKEAYPKP